MTAMIPTLVSTGLKVGGGLLASKMAGGNKQQSFSPTGFSGGGLEGKMKGGVFNIRSSENRRNNVANTAGAFRDQAGEINSLRGLVQPGIGRLTESRIGEIENARVRSIGNLRDNLSRRKVLGSSFAQDALARADLEFAQAKEKTRAESFLQELDQTNRLINQEFEARRGEFQTNLQELNLQADIASKLSQNATNVLAANARVKEEMAAKSAEGTGKFLGQNLSPLASKFGDFIGSQISPTPATGAV